MIIKKPWTESEISFLKNELQKGSRIKYISYELNRSQTAVSKFIARHGLSRRKNQYSINSLSNLLISPKIKYCRTEHNEIYPKLVIDEFVNFDTILNYLKSKSYKISSKVPNSLKSFYPNSTYLLNGTPISKTQMLILANKHRQEEYEDVFKCDAF